MAPLKLQKIHWRSVEGSMGGTGIGAVEVRNKGEIRFAPRTQTSCVVKMSISYELPEALVPLGTAVAPVVQGVISEDLKRFRDLAVREHTA